MDIFKMIARLTEIYFYLCLSLGFFASIFLCSSCVLKSWNIFVNSKNDFLEWLKVWKCKEYIKEKYNFAYYKEYFMYNCGK